MRRDRVVVTGGSGELGRHVIHELISQGYSVINVDRRPLDVPLCPTVVCDLCRVKEVLPALAETDIVVHLAAIPRPGMFPEEITFENNVMAMFNVCLAAEQNNVDRIVYASSDSAYGFAYAQKKFMPNNVPIDESHPLLPQDEYGLSKAVCEQILATWCRRTNRPGLALRLTALVSEVDFGDLPRDSHGNPGKGSRNFWSYVHISDAAHAFRLGCEAPITGFCPILISAPNTVASRPTRDLLKEHFDFVPDAQEALVGYISVESSEAARELLGWTAKRLCNNTASQHPR